MVHKSPHALRLSAAQKALIERPRGGLVFLDGPYGCGKTTVGVERLLWLMAQGVPGEEILLLLPQRTSGGPYYQALQNPGLVAGKPPAPLTLAGLAQRLIGRNWPGLAGRAGFAHPNQPPVFLNHETAQVALAQAIDPLLEQGVFESLTMECPRLYGQILLAMSEAAANRLPLAQIGPRLSAAWSGAAGQLQRYADLQLCADRFREYCLQRGLLDFSLQIDVLDYLELPQREWLASLGFRALIADNLEEQPPALLDILVANLPKLESALLIYDLGGGYRTLLSAAPRQAFTLRDLCAEQATLNSSFVITKAVASLDMQLDATLRGRTPPPEMPASPLAALAYAEHRFYPQMLDWVAGQVYSLIEEEGASLGEVVILAPVVSDALRFSLLERLERLGLAGRAFRPSRSLRDEPPAAALLTLACLAYPEWEIAPPRDDVAHALVQSIAGLDRVRAGLLAEIVYRVYDGKPALGSFDALIEKAQSRITGEHGERFEALRLWLEANVQDPRRDLDSFFLRLFDEILSQPGFGFYENPRAGEVVQHLAESAVNFRQAAERFLSDDERLAGRAFVRLMQSGLLPAVSLPGWLETGAVEVVQILPVTTFLLSYRPARYQFWLDIGASGWADRPEGPLAHPAVLSRAWPAGQKWTDHDEVAAMQDQLVRITSGLLARCGERIYLGWSELGEAGYEPRGPLLRALQAIIRPELGAQDGI